MSARVRLDKLQTIHLADYVRARAKDIIAGGKTYAELAAEATKALQFHVTGSHISATLKVLSITIARKPTTSDEVGFLRYALRVLAREVLAIQRAAEPNGRSDAVLRDLVGTLESVGTPDRELFQP